MDTRINATLNGLVSSVIGCVFLFIAIIHTQPWLIILVPFLAAYFFALQKFYIPGSRQLRRLHSVSNSKLLAHFSESQLGSETIRAFSRQVQFIDKFHLCLNENTKALYPLHTSNWWLNNCINITSSIVLLCCGLLAIYGGSVATGVVGVSLTFAFGISNSLGSTMRCSAQLQKDLVAVERLDEYSSKQVEAEEIRRSDEEITLMQ